MKVLVKNFALKGHSTGFHPGTDSKDGITFDVTVEGSGNKSVIKSYIT